MLITSLKHFTNFIADNFLCNWENMMKLMKPNLPERRPVTLLNYRYTHCDCTVVLESGFFPLEDLWREITSRREPSNPRTDTLTSCYQVSQH